MKRIFDFQTIEHNIIYGNTSLETEEVIQSHSEENTDCSRDKKRRILTKKPIIVSVLITIFLALSASYSWYFFTKDNHADTKELNIMTPYFLYLLNPDESNTLEFSVGNIYPGETKQIVICVSNKRPVNETDDNVVDIARDSYFEYDLEFIYTQNIPVNYTIYELKKNTLDIGEQVADGGIVVEEIEDAYWTKVINEGEEDAIALKSTQELDEYNISIDRWQEVFDNENPQIVNRGQYNVYKQDSNGVNLGLTYEYDTENNIENYEYDYYLIEISWQDEEMKFSKYTKETDMLYVIANSKQPQPKEQMD